MLEATCDDLVAKAAIIDLVRIDQELDTRGFIVIRDSDLDAVADAARAEYDRSMHALPLHAPREKFHYTALLDRPWRKAAIGSSNGVGDPYAQILQSIYFNANDTHYPALGRLFSFMISVRNRLMRLAPSFGSNPERDRFWNACRIHQYPRGGGFMAMHKDTHFPPIITSELGKPFCQVSVLLSRKNVDFFSGGGFVVDKGGKKIDLESEGGFGSLVLFDGRTFHGVEDVDLDQVIDFSRPDGRLAAFVSLYTLT
jgi:hypothetical protein